ncbi:hypothetical protein ACTHPH_10105 [Paenibacillus pasadenensis]|uniref:DUF5668 domain-containing protein n=1 Tax=Paenibacillus pasadenensis TaxID=217090 RepID=A0A2N5NAE0_9BACL|nr:MULTISPECIES: hypothetical protein [Paenibacillus]PLT47250.1 hypothetical protein B8V81_1474 [Paenibacillus pasadenensis]QGG57556.1 hypothetical protein GE073_19420 [Paenibacillus sp. B01]
MNRHAKAVLGAVLVLLGAYLMLQQGARIGPAQIFGHFWPSLFVIPLGIFFHWMYFSMLNRRGVGLLVPGGILLGAGLVSQFAMLLDNWGSIWPGFILAVALGLWELYWFGGRNRWLLIPINILIVLSLLFGAVFSISALTASLDSYYPYAALVLILGGSFLLLSRKRRED